MANTITSSGGAAAALVFESTTFEVVDQQGQQWLKSGQLAQALGYADEKSVNRIYARHSDEFTSAMTCTVDLTEGVSLTPSISDTPTLGLSGNLVTQTRIFSLRGAHLLAMFARTAIAALFRKWVLDILDNQTQPAAPYSVSPDQTLSAEQAAWSPSKPQSPDEHPLDSRLRWLKSLQLPGPTPGRIRESHGVFSSAVHRLLRLHCAGARASPSNVSGIYLGSMPAGNSWHVSVLLRPHSFLVGAARSG